MIISCGLAVVAPFAIIWFCDAKNVSHILPDYNNEVQMGLCESTVHTANPCMKCGACTAALVACAWRHLTSLPKARE